MIDVERSNGKSVDVNHVTISSSSSDEDECQMDNRVEKSVQEARNADEDLFKSTITAFDILSERCSELLGLFDNENETDLQIDSNKNRYI